MESVHRPEFRHWINQRKVSVKQFIEDWVNAGISQELRLDKNNLLEEARKELESICGDLDVVSAVMDDCDCEKLTVDSENDFVYVNYDKKQDISEFAEDTRLETLILQKKHLLKYREDKTYRSAVHSSMKYKTNHIVPSVSTEETDRPFATNDELINDTCAVLCCQLFKPVHASFETSENNRRTPAVVADQEIIVLSSQYLYELRDAYCCVSDIANLSDCSSSPNSIQTFTASDVYKSGFFFINNTFFNDMRNSSNIDYSQVIIEWSKESGRGIGPFESKLMDDTKFEELEIQLGYPYLYVHQGNCEHLLVFTDLRLHIPRCDSRFLKDYPKVVSTNKRTPIKCLSCNLNTAKWITYGNDRLCEDPFFFCDVCFRSFNYDKNNERIGTFKAYPFLDRTALL